MGIKPLKKAIENLQTKSTEFTPLHSLFALLCINAKAYRHAIPVIKNKVLSGFTNGYHDLESIMNYNYYRGLIFLALEDYEQAKHSFKLVIETPYHILHIVQICAFKKFALLTWLTSTHNINDSDHKAVRIEIKGVLYSKGMLGKQMEEITEDYCKAESINNFFIMQNQDEILKDTNLGLVKQVIKKIRNEVIESLTQTNTMLEIKEIEQRLDHHRKLCSVVEEEQKTAILSGLKGFGMEEVKMESSYEDDDLPAILLKYVKNGKIQAKIDMEKQTVIFEDENTSIQSLVKKLEEQNAQIQEVLLEVENTDKDLLFQKKAGIQDIDNQESMEYDNDMMDHF
mmetsp:Transcript_28528/g.25254  ORF Transcript_28528/g.25254 Transcript_28528/m.25254 type:complete len:341 (+) Transcript_28528:1-1023(+)